MIQPQRFPQPTCRLSALAVLLCVQVVCLGCFEVQGVEQESIKNQRDPQSKMQSERVKAEAMDYELSPLAQQVSDLLDREATAAAGNILKNKLDEHPDDAGLHVQLARLLILESDVAYSGVSRSPFDKSDTNYWAWGIADQAVELAVQLDPECKRYAATVVMTSLQQAIEAEFENGEGIIGWSRIVDIGDTRTGFTISTIMNGWTAIRADAETAAAFAEDYRKLMDVAAEKGHLASSAMLGNLYGDLTAKELEGNERDFAYACIGFRRALENTDAEKEERDWIAETIRICQLFKDELSAAKKGKTFPELDELEVELKKRGYSMFEPTKGKPIFGLN